MANASGAGGPSDRFIPFGRVIASEQQTVILFDGLINGEPCIEDAQCIVRAESKGDAVMRIVLSCHVGHCSKE